MEKRNMVIVYAEPIGHMYDPPVLLVEKNRPEWQKGIYNMPGGKMESGETPIQTAIRELEEECGFSPAGGLGGVITVGKIMGQWGIVHCIKVPVLYGPPCPKKEETERFFWSNWPDVANHSLLMPNLRVVIPICRMGVLGWTITDEEPSFPTKEHTFAVTVPAER